MKQFQQSAGKKVLPHFAQIGSNFEKEGIYFY